jgi:hypothetical protein
MDITDISTEIKEKNRYSELLKWSYNKNFNQIILLSQAQNITFVVLQHKTTSLASDTIFSTVQKTSVL